MIDHVDDISYSTSEARVKPIHMYVSISIMYVCPHLVQVVTAASCQAGAANAWA